MATRNIYWNLKEILITKNLISIFKQILQIQFNQELRTGSLFASMQSVSIYLLVFVICFPGQLSDKLLPEIRKEKMQKQQQFGSLFTEIHLVLVQIYNNLMIHIICQIKVHEDLWIMFSNDFLPESLLGKKHWQSIRSSLSWCIFWWQCWRVGDWLNSSLLYQTSFVIVFFKLEIGEKFGKFCQNRQSQVEPN